MKDIYASTRTLATTTKRMPSLLFSRRRSFASPRCNRRAVSRQRHHWLVQTSALVTPAA